MQKEQPLKNLLINYESLVYEIHLAVESGDLMATQGLPGMIAEKTRLEKDLKLSSGQQGQIFDVATASSPYRKTI